MKKAKRNEAPEKIIKITGAFYTNTITDNKTTPDGNVKNAHKDNAVYGRETSEIIRL